MDNEEIYSLLKQGEILEVEKALKSVRKIDEKILILTNLVKIFRNEVSDEVERTVFDYSTDIDELSRHYTKTKLMLRRIEFDMPQEFIDEFYEYCEDNGVSFCMLASMVMTNIIHKEKVCAGLIDLYRNKKGIHSGEAEFFEKLYNKVNAQGEN